MKDRRLLWPLLIFAAVIDLVFFLFTRWTLEDAMIVARIAGNFGAGGALAYNPTEWVSAATSPPYALVLGLLAKVHVDPLIAARCLGVVACTAVAAVVFRQVREASGRPGDGLLAAALYLLLPTTVAYSTAGLETPIYTLLIAFTLVAAAGGQIRALAWGALASIFRPDGLIALAVAVGILLQSRFFAAGSLKQRLRRCRPVWLGLAAGLAAVALAMAAHHAVYGTWVPQSMVAKRAVYAIDPWVNSGKYLRRMFLSQPWGLPVYALALIGCFQAWRRAPQMLVFAAWYLLYHAAFFARAPLFSWYLQPPMFVLAIFAGLGLWWLLARLEPAVERLGQRPELVTWAALAGLVVVGTAACAYYAQGRSKSATYEQEVRLATGRWLTAHTSADALVFTESLGFVGYGAANAFVDWPGLVTPGAPELASGLGRFEGFSAIIEQHRPSYLALRDSEWQYLQSRHPEYRALARFEAPPQVGGEAYVVAGNREP